jgi:hypothetical protein
MEESALRISLAISEMCRASWVPLLNLSTEFVVVGLVVDLFVVVWEYAEANRASRKRTIRPPEPPSIFVLILGLIGTLLITGGVAGELFCQSKINTIETSMRLTSDRLVNLVSREAGSARSSAEKAAEAADSATNAARRARFLADKADQESKATIARLAWRTITPAQHREFVAILERYKGSSVRLVMQRNPEAASFAQEIMSVLRDSHWKITRSVAGTISSNGRSFGGYGILCTVNEATGAGKSLAEVIKKLPQPVSIDPNLNLGPLVAIIVIGLKNPP